MLTTLAQFALLVKDYDEAISFYCGKLGFLLVEDTPMGSKRWVRIQVPGMNGSQILLSKAADENQEAFVGKQAGGRVLFFLHTDDFDADYKKLSEAGVFFVETPRYEVYGSVAVLEDLYGNRIDLIQPKH